MNDSAGGGIGIQEVLQYLWAGGAGVMGRIMYHAHLYQKGHRKPLIWMLCDVVIALGMGWAVLGLCNWFGLGWSTTQSFGIIAGWAGPQVIDTLITRSVDKYFGTEKPKPPEDDPKQG